MATTLDNLRQHLFGALEGIENLSDAKASAKDRTTLEQAKAICAISSEIIETYKVEVQAMGVLSKAENPNRVEQMGSDIGLLRLNRGGDGQ